MLHLNEPVLGPLFKKYAEMAPSVSIQFPLSLASMGLVPILRSWGITWIK